MEVKLQGKKIQLERKIKLWKEWHSLHNSPVHPLTMEEIAKRYSKPNGQPYSKAGVYKGLRRLRELEA